jgi:two-component sensor histidine kinase
LLSLAQCYDALNNKKIAEKYCEELIRINELRIKQKETPIDIVIYQFLALFYLDLKHYDKAEKYFRISMDDQHTAGRSTATLFQNNFLFKLDSAKGNYVAAIKHLQAWQAAKDSIFTETKSRQIEQVKIGYETEQKDQQLAFNQQNIQSLTKQDLLQKSKIRQGTTLRNISFAVVSLLIIVMALLYNRFRLKQKTNLKLKLQQTEIEKQNISLQHLINEKDWLVKEIHHRVKNNLQIVMSLLNSQSAYIDNEVALTAIHDSQHRVHAMSLIHQKLYNTENVSSIDMPSYIRELASYLGDSFDTGQRIRFEIAIEPLEMDVSQAVPLGLILNEAITNSIKYAFPNNREGVIKITLSNVSGNQYLLEISDNGIGIPSHLKNKKVGSLGLSLMAGLSEDLDGTFSIENNNGTLIKISFTHDITIKLTGTLATSLIANN